MSETESTSAGEIFVVDDNPQNLNLLAGILRRASYEVRMTNSAKRALQAIMRSPPELILLDVNMPEMNGYEVCERLKRDPLTHAIPVIFLSALDDLRDKVKAFEAGGVDYVTKPFHAEEVLARVESQIKLARLRRALEERNEELARRNEELLAAQRREAQIFSALSDVLPGTTLNGAYRLGEKIGAGGFAAVFKGVQLLSGREVAIKVLRPAADGRDVATRARLLVEGRSAVRLDHPSAVAVLDSGTTPAGISYLVMELLEGASLHAELERSGPLPLARALEIMIPVCEVLAEAHARGVIHRDIKPANIFLHRDRVKVVDFGIAKLDDDDITSNATTIGRLIGTPIYMAPERLLGKAYDGGADVYAVGVTLYETLTGQMPFVPEEGGIGAVVLACVHQEPVPLRAARGGLPASLEEVVMRTLAKSALERPTMSALLRSLQSIASGAPRVPAADTVDVRGK
jgi:CheY-like chemotaxis protein